jgi:transposase-like protein
MSMKTSRTTLPLYEKDREAIKTIREYYGLRADADAIRVALHELERMIKQGASPAQTPKKERRSHPPQK